MKHDSAIVADPVRKLVGVYKHAIFAFTLVVGLLSSQRASAQTISFTQKPSNPYSGNMANVTVHMASSYSQDEECDPYDPRDGAGCWLNPMVGAPFDTATFKFTNNSVDNRGAFGLTYSETCQATGTYGTGYYCTQYADAVGSVPVTAGQVNTFQAKISDTYYSWTQTATYAFTVQSAAAVSVTPKNSTQIILDSAATRFLSATVKNTGNQTTTYSLGVVCSGAASACATIQWVACGNAVCAAPLTSATLAPNAERVIDLSVTASGARGALGLVKPFAAIDATHADTGVLNTKVRDTHFVTIAPVTSSLQARPGQQLQAQFDVRVVDSTASRTVLSATCTGSAAAAGCVTTLDTIVASAPGSATTRVAIAFSSTRTVGQSGVVTLNAAIVNFVEGAFAVSSQNTAVTAPPPLTVVDVDSVPPGDILERKLCLTLSVSSGAASECGDLRLVHNLPKVRTMNRARGLTLLYNSQHAHPVPIISALVTPPATSALPASVELRVLIGGVARSLIGGGGVNRTVASWPGSQWGSAGQSRRVAAALDTNELRTGLQSYDLEVTLVSSAGTRAVTTTTGLKLPVVNRVASPFGAGWTVAGVESFDPVTKVWVGGDGSVRQYRPTTISNRWAATAISYPDTIALVGNRYVRYSPDSLRVYFDASTGRHVETRNRFGWVTTFHYNANGWLDTLTVPTPGNGGGLRDPNDSTGFTGVPAKRSYTLSYFPAGAAHPDRVEITAPAAVSGSIRRTVLQLVSADTVRNLVSITDPDASSVQFTYGVGPRLHVVSGRVDRIGIPTTFDYDVTQRLIIVGRGVGADTSRTRIRPAESMAVAGTALPAAHLLSQYATKIDGPRAAIGDTTLLWLNRFGAPLKTQTPDTVVTIFDRGDARWPGLVTRTQIDTGRTQTAVYDSRGRMIATSDVGVGPAGQDAVTRIVWDSLWNSAISMTTPTGVRTRFGYSLTTGNRLWVQPGDDVTRRTGYQYYANSGLLRSTTAPGVAPDRVIYDNLGNVTELRSPANVRQTIASDSAGRQTLAWKQIDVAATQWGYDSTVYDLGDRVAQTIKYAPAIPGVYGANQARLIVSNFYNAEGATDSVLRAVSPDTFPIRTLRLRWRYDALGRVRAAVDVDGHVDSTWYDPAGLAIGTRTRRGHVLTMEYDVVGRLIKRRLPTVTYAKRTGGIAARNLGIGYDNPPYPRYRDSDDSLRIRLDSNVYTYSHLGQLIAADNRDARIRRSYDRRGLLVTDSTWIRTVAEPGQGGSLSHAYGVKNEYDLDGRRTLVWQPTQLTTGSGKIAYWFDPVTGQLSGVTDPVGNTFSYHYAVDGAVDSVYMPGGVVEGYQYDPDGNQTRHTVRQGSYWLRSETRQFDATGAVRSTKNAYGAQDTLWTSYNGFGHLAHSEQYAHGVDEHNASHRFTTIGDFRADPMGNQVFNQNEKGDETVLGDSHSSSSLTIRLALGYDTTGHQFLTYHGDTYQMDSSFFDPSGNIEFATQTAAPPSTAFLFDRATYYNADQRPFVAEYREYPDYYTYRSVFEEYRYDALGRRIWTRTRQYCVNAGDVWQGECSNSTVRRTVWDGDNELFEIQTPAGNATAASVMEDDTNPVPPQQMVGGLDINPYFGRVAYTHGLATDQPLSIIRLNYADWPANKSWGLYPVFTLVPLWNGRGQADAGYFAATGPGFKLTYQGDQNRAVRVDYPAAYVAFGEHRILWAFQGTVITDKEDAARTLFRRNRTYDPLTGRFTQEDPIGLAGGVSAYGFANGDPANYSDPFGLCPIATLRNLGRRTTNTADCPHNAIGDALREIDAHGGAYGKKVLKLIADDGKNIEQKSGVYLTAACDAPHPACHEGSDTYVVSGEASGAELAGMIFHEALHDVFSNKNLSIEETGIWQLQLDLMEGIRGGSSDVASWKAASAYRANHGREAFGKMFCPVAQKDYKSPCP